MSTSFVRVATATGCDLSPAAGSVTLYAGWNYVGPCSEDVPWGSYGAGSLDNDIASMQFGGSKNFTDNDGITRSYLPRWMACQGASFTGYCAAWITEGNIPDYHNDPELNFLNTVSSYRVQRYTDVVRFPTNTTYTYSDGTTTKNCTWGAARQLHDVYGIYPGWRGNANEWDENAAAAFYKVDNTPQSNSILNVEAGTDRTVAKGWSGSIYGGHPTTVISDAGWPPAGSAGHVGWIVDVRVSSGSDGVYGNADDETWLHTVESNVGTSKSGWSTFIEGGAVFFHMYIRFDSSADLAGMSIIHPIG